MGYYDNLLGLCGFEPGEIDRERARIERAFRRLDLGPADMAHAEEWVRANHEVELSGVRKILRLWLLELVDLVLARDDGKKVLYYGFPAIGGPAMAIAAASPEVHCTCPDVVLCQTMGQIFDKLTPILEAGEQNGLPPGHGLCSLQQIRVGALAQGMIPVPDLVMTSSYYCDMGSKTDELLHERYGHPAIYIDGSMDSRWGEFPDYAPERVGYLSGRLEQAFAAVKDVLGIEVTPEARSEGASSARALFGALAELVGLTRSADPQPLSIITSELARRFTTGSAGRRLLAEGPAAVSLLNQEVRERINRGVGVVEEGAPRVTVFIASYSNPEIMRMVEKCGLSIPATLTAYAASRTRQKTPFITGETLAAEEMARGVFHSCYGVIKWTADAVRESRLDGVIWNYIFNCRPLAITSHLLRQFVEKETGVPVLALETDLFDSRTYSAAALRTRVETFAEILRARKAAITG